MSRPAFRIRATALPSAAYGHTIATGHRKPSRISNTTRVTHGWVVPRGTTAELADWLLPGYKYVNTVLFVRPQQPFSDRPAIASKNASMRTTRFPYARPRPVSTAVWPYGLSTAYPVHRPRSTRSSASFHHALSHRSSLGLGYHARALSPRHVNTHYAPHTHPQTPPANTSAQRPPSLLVTL